MFPSAVFPADADKAKLLGLYQQKQDGLWMQRIKILGGVMSGPQWLGVAEIAAEFTPETPLHLTTRQEVELHCLKTGQIPAVQKKIAELGLTGLGACGDTLRNVTVCPRSGALIGGVNLLPLGWLIRRMLEGTECIFSLPRKFKVSLCACGKGCCGTWINDIGLVAKRNVTGWTFDVIAAGSLGPGPDTGMLLYEGLAPNDVLPLVLAMLRIFDSHGDRVNRGRARLRHIRQRVGDDAFAAMIWEEYGRVRNEREWPEVELPDNPVGFDAELWLTFPNGDVDSPAAEAIGRLADRDDVQVRITTDHRVIVFGSSEERLAEYMKHEPALTDPLGTQPCVVACPGGRWCKKGLVDTNRIADRIRSRLEGIAGCDAGVHISGCPNSCAHSAVAEIGLIGMRTGGEETFRLLLGGTNGRTGKLAKPAGERLSFDEAVEAVVSAVTGGRF